MTRPALVVLLALCSACGRSAPFQETIAQLHDDAGQGGGGGHGGGSGGGSGGGGGAICSADAGCLIDVALHTTTCAGLTGFTSVTFSGSRGLATLDMRALREVAIEADLCSPAGWSFSIGDSPTNNGYCGDSSTRSNDAELWVLDQSVGVCENDLATTNGGTKALWSFAGPAANVCSTLRFVVRDSGLDYPNQNQSLSSPFLFRFGQPDAEGGKPDWDLFLGLNQVPQGDRTGSGLQRVRLNLGACR